MSSEKKDKTLQQAQIAAAAATTTTTVFNTDSTEILFVRQI